MRTGIVQGTPIHRELYRALDPLAKLVMLANGHIVLGDDGLPRIADPVMAQTVADVEKALGLRA